MSSFSIVKKILIVILCFIILAIISALLIWYFMFSSPSRMDINEPKFGTKGATVIYMNSGKSINELAIELESRHVIRSAKVFLSIIERLRLGKTIKQGIYVFEKPQHVFKIINRFARAEYGYIPTKVTFPEGYTVKDIARTLEQKLPSISSTEFISLAKDKEGYLFPDTYFFYPLATSTYIIRVMQNNFDKRIASLQPEFASTSLNLSRTTQDIIIMASIIEKEVRTSTDKAIVSDIFWKRIKIGMPLQADSTLTYVTGKTSAELTLNDLTAEDQFNSYKNRGLPPTPISNPGLDSIKAALRPEPNPYLFFLSDNEGTSHFAKTYTEHLQLKKKYLP